MNIKKMFYGVVLLSIVMVAKESNCAADLRKVTAIEGLADYDIFESKIEIKIRQDTPVSEIKKQIADKQGIRAYPKIK